MTLTPLDTHLKAPGHEDSHQERGSILFHIISTVLCRQKQIWYFGVKKKSTEKPGAQLGIVCENLILVPTYYTLSPELSGEGSQSASGFDSQLSPRFFCHRILFWEYKYMDVPDFLVGILLEERVGIQPVNILPSLKA